jgi:uncharacterized protein
LKPFFINLLLFSLILYLLLAAYLIFGGWAERLILFPSNEPLHFSGLSRQALSNDLELWMTDRTEREEIFILHFVGNASRAETDLLALKELWQGYPVALFSLNYPAYGGSLGPASLTKMAQASLVAYNQVYKMAHDKPIIVSGNSIGTSLALYVAAHKKVAGIFLKNPPPLQKLILGEHGRWNLWLLAAPIALAVPGQLDSIKNSAQANVPALFVMAENDEIVPPKYQKLLLESYAGPKHIVSLKGADHNYFPLVQNEPKLKPGLDWLINETKGKSL